MNELLAYLWQSNIELTLLLAVIWLARSVIRKTTKNYNAYLLWLSIPVGLGVAKLISFIDFSQPPTETVNYLIGSYVVKPIESFDTWTYVAYGWFFVSLLLILRLIKQHSTLRADLKRIIVPYQFKIASKYTIVGIDKEGFSPAVYGFINPKIYFPIQLVSELSEEQIQLIIRHEEHHISQKHLWLNLLWDILVCLVWFNPLIYLSRQNFRHDQEVYCDYLVLDRVPEPEHKTYGHALLSTVSATHSVSLLCSWKMFNQLEERIMSIKNTKRKSNKLAIALGCIGVLATTSLYAINMNSFKQLDKDGSHSIEWTIDGKSYVNRDGDWLVYENGNKRPMTKKERQEFEEAVERAEEEMRHSEKEMLEAEKEMVLAQLEIERSVAEMEKAQEEITRSFEGMEQAFMEIEQSHLDVQTDYLEGKLSKEEFETIQKELKKAQEQLKNNQGRYQLEIQRAKEQLEKSRRQFEKERENLRVTPVKHIGLRLPPAPKVLKGEASRVPPPVNHIGIRVPPAPKVLKGEASRVPPPPSAAIPVKTVPAKYPVQAVKGNIEGYVNMEFDLNEHGAPSNIRVRKAYPKNMFETAAVEAIKKWKFKTKGKPASDMRYKLEFRL